MTLKTNLEETSIKMKNESNIKIHQLQQSPLNFIKCQPHCLGVVSRS